MRIIIITAMLLGVIGSPAQADLMFIDWPSTAETGETYRTWINGRMPNSCWHFVSMTLGEEAFEMIVEITIAYDNPSGDWCLGPSGTYDLYPRFVFNYPGNWTLRVVEHRIHPANPDYPSYTVELPITVTGMVPNEGVSFGGFKARYR